MGGIQSRMTLTWPVVRSGSMKRLSAAQDFE